jgi:hypothetical protein
MARPVGSKNRTPEEIMRDAEIEKTKAKLKLLEQKKAQEKEKKRESEKKRG